MWLLLGLYKPPNQNTTYFIKNLSSTFDHYLKNYDNVTVIRNINLSIDDIHLESFLKHMTKLVLSRIQQVFNQVILIQVTSISKKLRKTIMKKSKLKNKDNKDM